jgi:hypothetical protein
MNRMYLLKTQHIVLHRFENIVIHLMLMSQLLSMV